MVEKPDLQNRHLCQMCIGDEYLADEVGRKGKEVECSYCGETELSFSIPQLAELVEAAFDQHYRRTSNEPDEWQLMLLKDKESSYEWDREGEPVVYAIMNAADIPEDAASDIQEILEDQYSDFDKDSWGEETEFDGDSYYEEKATSDAAWRESWEAFERSLKTEARFFSKSAADHLASIFDGIEDMTTANKKPLVRTIGIGSDLLRIFRARVFQSDESLVRALCRPDLELGSPPARLAKSGRMNAAGISVFYGSTHAAGALAEVRPPVGSQVAVAEFEILKPLRVLDLTALSGVSVAGSVFDPSFADRKERAAFLRSLSYRITKPVMPDDETFDYLATQAVADFLATEAKIPLDGILYPSVQAEGEILNIVLFHKVARVEELELPKGSKVRADTTQATDEGYDIDYTVIEEVPAKAVGEEKKPERLTMDDLLDDTIEFIPNRDYRTPCLKIITKTMEVHIVKHVNVNTDAHSVTRHRWEITPTKNNEQPAFKSPF